MSLSRKEVVCTECRQVGVRQNTSKHWDSTTNQWLDNESGVMYDCADCGECDVEEIDVPLPLLQVDVFAENIDGNAFSILGAFQKQALKEGWSHFEISIVTDKAKDGNYDHMIQTLMAQTDFGKANEVEDES